MFWKKQKREKWIPVLPKNYRSIALKAIEIANEPHVLLDKKEIYDFSDQGRLTQKGIRKCINFEIRNGELGIVGFHDHPNEMWITESYENFASICEEKGWLKIQGHAS